MNNALKRLWSDQVTELKFFTLFALASLLVGVCPYTHTLYKCLLLLSLAYGIVLLCKLFFLERLLFRNKYFPLLMLFVVSYGITILLNRDRGFFTNCGQLMYTCLYFFVFFCHYSMLNRKQRAEVLRPALQLMLVFALIIAGISLIMLLMQYHVIYKLGETELHIGVTRRGSSLQLAGIASGGPTLSGLCFGGILAATLLLFSDWTDKRRRCFCVGAVIVLVLTLCAANAYAGLVNLAALGFSYAACRLLTGVSSQRGVALAKEVCLALLAAVFVSACIFAGYFYIQGLEAGTVNKISEILSSTGADKLPGIGAGIDLAPGGELPGGELPGGELPDTKLPDITIQRNILSSINSGRFTIWRAAIEQLFLIRPLFGWTNANLSVKVFYGVPDYIYYNLHSGYLTLLAGAGLIGFSLIILFGLLLLVQAMRFLFVQPAEQLSKGTALLISACIGILAGDLVNGCFVLWRGYLYILLWLFLGEIYALIQDRVDIFKTRRGNKAKKEVML